jgi:hypothetical protein
MRRCAVLLGSIAVVLFVGNAATAVPFVLSNGPGDGTLSVGVDGYGAFGSSVGPDSSDAIYDPVGAGGPAGTSFESGVAIGRDGARQFLSSGLIGSSGGLVNPTVTAGISSFSLSGLDFTLTQSLDILLDSGVQTGTVLNQVYSITNIGNNTVNFDMVRYLDGDLLFDGSLTDGGGRLVTAGGEMLFETDSATGAADATTFVGISTEGGTISLASRFEIDSFSGLRNKILTNALLDDSITGDGNLDDFVDAGGGYDITLALRKVFSLAPGTTDTYTTRTFFGSGAPEDVPQPGPSVPEPDSAALFVAGALVVARFSRRAKG